MSESRVPSRAEIRESCLDRARETRAGITSGEYVPAALDNLVITEIGVALHSDDPEEIREHLRRAAEASRELFALAWPNRDNLYKAKIYGDDGSGTGPSPAIEGMHAGLASGDLELARDIARHSGFKDDKRFSAKSQRLYADALRSWLLTGEFDGFSRVPHESGTVTFSSFARIFLLAKDDPRTALTELEEVSRKFMKSRLSDEAHFGVCILSLRIWLTDQLRA